MIVITVYPGTRIFIAERELDVLRRGNEHDETPSLGVRVAGASLTVQVHPRPTPHKWRSLS